MSNPNFTSDSGVLFNKDKTTLICCPAGKSGDYTIPDSVTSIGNSAFDGCSSLAGILIPDSVTSIDSYAIGYGKYDFENRTYIKIPNFAIYGSPDSEAERYANDNDFKFIPILTTTEGITVALEDEETAKAASTLTLTTKEITKTTTDTSVNYHQLNELIENTVKSLTPDAASDVTYTAYDISLLDANNKPIQPKGIISFRIPLPSGYKADTCHIYRLKEDNTFTDMKATCSNDVLTFRTNHFNIYVITEQTLADTSDLNPGDVNGDGEVDIADALLISRYDARLTEFDSIQFAYADVNDDNDVNIADALLISRYDAKLIDSLSGK